MHYGSTNFNDTSLTCYFPHYPLNVSTQWFVGGARNQAYSSWHHPAERAEIKQILRRVQLLSSRKEFFSTHIGHLTLTLHWNAKKCNCIQVLAYCRRLAKQREQVQFYHSGGCLFLENVCTHWIWWLCHKTTRSLYKFYCIILQFESTRNNDERLSAPCRSIWCHLCIESRPFQE